MTLEVILVAAVCCGAIGAAILLTKFELLTEVVTLVFKAIFKFVWLIVSAVFEIIKSIFDIIIRVFISTTPPDRTDNET